MINLDLYTVSRRINELEEELDWLKSVRDAVEIAGEMKAHGANDDAIMLYLKATSSIHKEFEPAQIMEIISNQLKAA